MVFHFPLYLVLKNLSLIRLYTVVDSKSFFEQTDSFIVLYSHNSNR